MINLEIRVKLQLHAEIIPFPRMRGKDKKKKKNIHSDKVISTTVALSHQIDFCSHIIPVLSQSHFLK